MTSNSTVREAEATSDAIRPVTAAAAPTALAASPTSLAVIACWPRLLMALVYCHAQPPAPTLES